MRDLLPNGMLGLALAGLLASFMAGMAANISAFNTVFSYDIWQTYIVKDKPDHYYLSVGRLATVAATVVAIGTAFIASQYTNIMDYIQTLFGFFNAPLFATFILGLLWARMSPAAGWTAMVAGPSAAGVVGWLSRHVSVREHRGPAVRRSGRKLRRRRAAFVASIVVGVLVTLVSRRFKSDSELRGLVYRLTPREDITTRRSWGSLVPEAGASRRCRAGHRHRPQRPVLVKEPS